MQTHFTPAQLQDPDTSASERILRKCVHCGFCTATCPTYVLLGDELDSPRGRIVLIKDLLESGRAATPEVVRHVDRCLSCLACVTTCPSGVDYRHLVDHARVRIERTYRRPFADRAVRALIAAVVPHPRRFRSALRLARWAKPLTPLLPPRLRAMVRLAPSTLPPPPSLRREVHPANGQRRLRVALLTGCAQAVLTPETHAASIRLLTRAGAEVVTIGGCCGALTHHMGRDARSSEFGRALLQALATERDSHGLDAVVSDASGCGLHVKDYAWQFREDPAMAAVAADLAARARDVCEVVAQLGLPPLTRGAARTVAYHSACTLQHGQKLDALPRALLREAGYDVREVPEGHLCCGSAGTYNLLQPAIAASLRERKLANVRSTGAEVIATGNVGCAMQLSGEGGLPVFHTVQLLDIVTA